MGTSRRTWKCKAVIKTAIEVGYTHINTAWRYDSHSAIGEALRELGAKRDRLFITSKIWSSHLRYNAAIAQCNECLERLQTDYLDLLLIHHPSGMDVLEETLAAFSHIHNEGKAISIGISNFTIDHVNQAQKLSQIPISVNQVEYHVRYNREDLLPHCTQHQIVLTAHRPLAKGALPHEPLLRTIAANHGKAPAQIALRWLLQKGMIVIPKASSETHLRENLDIFNWELTPNEMNQLNNIGTG